MENFIFCAVFYQNNKFELLTTLCFLQQSTKISARLLADVFAAEHWGYRSIHKIFETRRSTKYKHRGYTSAFFKLQFCFFNKCRMR